MLQMSKSNGKLKQVEMMKNMQQKRNTKSKRTDYRYSDDLNKHVSFAFHYLVESVK